MFLIEDDHLTINSNFLKKNLLHAFCFFTKSSVKILGDIDPYSLNINIKYIENLKFFFGFRYVLINQ